MVVRIFVLLLKKITWVDNGPSILDISKGGWSLSISSVSKRPALLLDLGVFIIEGARLESLLALLNSMPSCFGTLVWERDWWWLRMLNALLWLQLGPLKPIIRIEKKRYNIRQSVIPLSYIFFLNKLTFRDMVDGNIIRKYIDPDTFWLYSIGH